MSEFLAKQAGSMEEIMQSVLADFNYDHHKFEATVAKYITDPQVSLEMQSLSASAAVSDV